MSRLLKIAVSAGIDNAVRVHINRGDDINARDERGQTPLMLSAARNRANVCRLLLAAGADPNLLDPLGRDALRIAKAAGAVEAALAIETACASPAPATALSTAGLAVKEQGATFQLPDGKAELQPASAPDPDEGAIEFDLSGWEADEEQGSPQGDPSLIAVASDAQAAITRHRPIDISVDWTEVDAFLPERATPLQRTDDAEARAKLRLALVWAIREGSVPLAVIEGLTREHDLQPDEESCAMLSSVINDLGAEVDERLEFRTRDVSSEVFVSAEPTPVEEELVAEAMAFLDDLASPRNEPLRIYQRELQREALLTGPEEVALGQAMERGIEQALDALASWPEGIDAVLAAAREVARGTKPLRWMSSRSQSEPQGEEWKANLEPGAAAADSGRVDDGPPASEEESADADFDLTSSGDELGEFSSRAEALASASGCEQQAPEDWERRRSALASLGLARSFLMQLADAPLSANRMAATEFVDATRAYRRARDRFAAANLKLVHSIAKKYLFTGQPFDDLLQEGNIGLLRAVDRFDWRRGFKFSTFATWWIRQQVWRFVADKGKTIRLPVHVYEKMQRVAQAARAYELRHGRDATDEELAELVNMPVHKVKVLARLRLEPLPIQDVLDLDEVIAVDAKDRFTAPDPCSCVEEVELRETLSRLLSALAPREQDVIRMRYGIGTDNDAMTLEEVGARAGVTRERIRQIEAKAMRRLKHPALLDSLRKEFGLKPERQKLRETILDHDDAVTGRASVAEDPQVEPEPASAAQASSAKGEVLEEVGAARVVSEGRLGAPMCGGDFER